MNSLTMFAGIAADQILSKEQQTKITGGKKDITCSFTVNDPSGPVSYSGACASSDINQCTQYAGATASQMAISSGYGVDYSCSAGGGAS